MARRAPRPIDDDYAASLQALGRRSGLDHVGIAPATVMQRARDALVERKGHGLSDSMAFTYRNPHRSTDPTRTVLDARSLVVAARCYHMEEPARPPVPSAAVARYAWVDHYEPLRCGLRAIAGVLRADGYRAVAVADDNALVDREAAWLAGLGWFGKNANLLVPGAGSFFVLGSVITDAPLRPAVERVADGCGTCSRCIEACPTGAIVAPGVVDARRCLAWLLQRPGIFPREHRRALGTRIYGCDDCQTVCPPTVRFTRRRQPPATDDAAEAWVDLVTLLRADDATIMATYGRWYIAARNPVWVRRNALVALGNAAEHARRVDVHSVLRDYIADDDPVLRAHAVWAAATLGLHHLLPATDPDELVVDELTAAAAGR